MEFLMRISAIAAAAAMSLLVGGVSLPAHSATSVGEGVTRTTTCFMLLLTDPDAHARRCGVTPSDEGAESLSPEGGGEETPEETNCVGWLDLDALQPGERVRIAAVGPCDFT
jgi:hypothetical protein